MPGYVELERHYFCCCRTSVSVRCLMVHYLQGIRFLSHLSLTSGTFLMIVPLPCKPTLVTIRIFGTSSLLQAWLSPLRGEGSGAYCSLDRHPGDGSCTNIDSSGTVVRTFKGVFQEPEIKPGTFRSRPKCSTTEAVQPVAVSHCSLTSLNQLHLSLWWEATCLQSLIHPSTCTLACYVQQTILRQP